MAAFGFEYFLKKPKKLPVIIATLISVIVLAVTWHFLLGQKTISPLGHFATVSYRNMILPSVLTLCVIVIVPFLLIRKKFITHIGFVLLLILSIGGIVYFADKYLFFSERKFTFPITAVISQLSKITGNNRVWSFGEGYMGRNFGTYYHLQSPEGYDSFYIRTYGELLKAAQNGGKLTTDIPRADAQLTGVSRISEITKNKPLVKLLNLLGVKYIFAKKTQEDSTFLNGDQKMFRQTWSDGKYSIYENTLAYPRVFLSDSYETIPDPKKQLQTMFSNDTDLSKLIILDKNPHLVQTKEKLFDNVVISSYNSEKISIQIQTNKSALLFLSDNNYPGWIATIDGKQTEILTADHTFRSVVVPQGRHIIVFSYQPKSVAIGFGMGIVGLLLFAYVGFTIKKNSLKK